MTVTVRHEARLVDDTQRTSGPRVVVAHEWVTNFAGSEAVVDRLLRLFPDATLVAGVVDPGLVASRWPGLRVTSLLSPRLPGVLTHWQRYAPLLLRAWSAVTIDCDILVCSSHFASHGAAAGTTAGVRLSYYHTPMRLAWRPDLEGGRLPAPARAASGPALSVLRAVDRRRAQHVTHPISNSGAIRVRLRDAYGRDSAVVNPPVDVHRFGDLRRAPAGYYLVFGRLVSYKRVDIAIAACTRLGLPLVVAGSGPMADELRRLAGPTVRFVDPVDDATRLELFTGARALLFPGEEDFGIVPAEAIAAGVPVVAYGAGGVLDYMTDRTGTLVPEQTVEAFTEVLRTFHRSGGDATGADRDAVAHLAPESFDASMRRQVAAAWAAVHGSDLPPGTFAERARD